MSIALEVSFRGLPPSEALVEMAAQHYRQFKRDQPELGECLVLLEVASGARKPLTRATVRLGAAGSANAEQAEAEHRDPHLALEQALQALRVHLDLPALRPPPSPATTPRTLAERHSAH